MKSDSGRRYEALCALLELQLPLQPAIDRLAKFEWDSEALVTLQSRHIVSTLQRFLQGEINANIVEAWANALEGRDDVDIDSNLEDIIFDLANPALQGALTMEQARDLLDHLGGQAGR
ncbi:MAG: hypothetical protein QOD77_1882 [Thermoplasmata archaeon]|nr:hypothetical protein [Thermoplasmata archaeon]